MTLTAAFTLVTLLAWKAGQESATLDCRQGFVWFNMSSVPFFIANTSPLFSYSPCKNCDVNEGWQSAYAPRVDGLDQTFHQSSNTSAEIAFNISASSLDFITAGGEDCTATYIINGSDPISACTTSANPLLPSLPSGIHRIIFKANAPSDSPFRFFGIQGTIAVPASTINKTIDMTPSDVTHFKPPNVWTHLTSSSLIGEGGVDGLDLEETQSQSLSLTKSGGAAAEIAFNASTIYIYGTTSAAGGKVKVGIDGQDAAIVDMNSPWTTYSALVYMHRVRDSTQAHTISFTNVEDGNALILDYVVLTSERFATAGPPATTDKPGLIAGIAIGITTLFIFALAAFIHLRRRKRKRARPTISNPRAHPSFIQLYESKDSSELASSAASSFARSYYSYHPPEGGLARHSGIETLVSVSPFDPARSDEAYTAKSLHLQKLVTDVTEPPALARRSVEVDRWGTQSSFGDMMSPTTPFSDVMAIEDTAVRATRSEARFVAPQSTLTPPSQPAPVAYHQPRRAISIKSAKSGKSFWSALLSSGSSTAPPVPPRTPAAAARPDSGLFGHYPRPSGGGDIMIDLNADSPTASPSLNLTR